MDFFTSALGFFWIIRTVKYVLFWLYLWQLKEYHIPRFADHFSTQKGRNILVNFFTVSKVILLAALLANDWLAASAFFGIFYALLAVYVAEGFIFAAGVARRQVKLPVFTGKMILLTVITVIALGIFSWGAVIYAAELTQFTAALLLFDIFLPLLVSLVVLLVQPFFVLLRLRILRKAAHKLNNNKNLLVIGITGSYGKTSTKEFLKTILSTKYKVLVTPEHRNSEMGIAKTILEELQPYHEIFIVEMGAYLKGGIKLLCDMVHPQIGMVVGVNSQHLALFGSLDNLLSAEGGRELAAALPPDGMLVVNGDNQYCLDLYKNFPNKKKVYTVEKGKIQADIWTEELEMGEDSISFVVQNWHKELAHVTVTVLGKQQVQNLLAAFLVARELGMTMEEIATAAQQITQKQGGMTRHQGVHGIGVIDSSYSANPDGVMADLDYLNVFGGKKVIVMPCLIELGPLSGQIHHDIGKKIGQICTMAIITTKEQFEQIKKGAVAAGMAEKNIIFSEHPQEIFHHITTMCGAGDAVLLEGRVPGEVIKLLKEKGER